MKKIFKLPNQAITKPENYILTVLNAKNKINLIPYAKRYKPSAFSLVEMLMALLVASLLMTALAPVMTKKFGNENVVVSDTGRNTSEHFKIFDDATKNGTDENKFTIPSNAINVRITMIGGGGAGGGATFGSKVITATERDWKIPDGVKKIRVYMVGGGGGGASADINLANQTGQLNAGYKDYLTAGQHSNQKISTLITENRTFHPAVDSKCANSKYNDWEANISSLAITATGCGAGGAGGGREGGGGGSGGYKSANFTLPDNYIIRVPGKATTGKSTNAENSDFSSGAGGGGGASGSSDSTFHCSNAPRYAAKAGTYGGAGGIGYESYCGAGASTAGGNGSGTLCAYGGGYLKEGSIGGRGGYYGGGGGGGNGTNDYGGGGGGGPAIIMNSSNSVLFIASGGGGGGGDGSGSNNGAGGGGGGGPEGGGGGGGGGYNGCSNGGGAGAGGGFRGDDCGSCTGTACYTTRMRGGGGGGAKYGVSGTSHTVIANTSTSTSDQIGTGGKLSTNVFGDNYCNGGNANQNGKPGAIRISWAATSNALKCKYNTYSNGSPGGGAGQVWIGELNVTPGQYLNFFIGNGGAKQTNYSTNGNNGENTYIANQAGTVLISVSGGGGGLHNNTTNGGVGGGKLNSNWYDWTGQNANTAGGQAGSPGKTIANSSSGGKGGGIYLMDGSFSDGGNPGNAESNGYDATTPGTGGGGGGGITIPGHFPGYGGRGANGYIYIEWGDSNGGGGSSGEIIEEKTIVSATANSKLEIIVGKGGKAVEIQHDTLTKYKPGSKGGNGGDTIIKVGSKTYKAKGGIGGDGGGLTKGEHGKGGKLESLTGTSSKSYEGQQGIDGFGGMGASSIYKSQASGDGIGGCGGSMISGKCFSPAETPYGKDGSPSGSGGGGGSIQNSTPYKGGNGADGLVLIEWEEFRE